VSTEGKSTVGGVSWRIRWQYALIIVAAAILFFWEPIDDWLNFQTETVEVKAVQTLCTAFDKASPVPREVGPCDEIRAEYGSNALVDIREQTFAAFDYTSPADGKVHSTKIVRDKDDAGQPIHAGSRISVQLSSKQADFVK
jgi:hypothetical protein